MSATRVLAVCLALTSSLAPAQLLTDFFNDAQIQDLKIVMAPADWQKLKDNYLENTYYRCDFQWNSIVVKDVGMRSRGTGSRSPIKPAIGLDFTRFTKSQRFLDMRGLVLRNFSQDPTTMHERLAQKLFHRMGLPYSRTVHARLFINDQYAGLYLVVEPLDERFLRTRFGSEEGYLFEALGGNGYDFRYVGDNPVLYTLNYFDPKTHSSDPKAEKLVEWIRDMNQVSDSEFVSAMARYVDVGAFVTHVAIDQFLGDWDSVLADSGMTNFYLARPSETARWVFLTWDKDMALSTANLSVWRNTQNNVLMRRALAVPEYRRRFLEALWQIADAVGGDGGWFFEEAQRGFDQVQQAVQDDPNRVCTIQSAIVRCGFDQFLTNSEFMLNVIRGRASAVRLEVRSAGFDPAAYPFWLAAGSVFNLASGSTNASPLSLAAADINGVVTRETRALEFPCPRELDGTRVNIGGLSFSLDAPVLVTTSLRTVFQVPGELAFGPTPVRITRGTNSSNTAYVEVLPNDPGVFAVAHLDGSVVNSLSPAAAGEQVMAWGSGFTAAKPMATGMPAPMDRLMPLDVPLSAVLASQSVRVVWAGSAPNMAGMQQILFEVPAASQPGNFGLSFILNGEPGPAFTLPVH